MLNNRKLLTNFQLFLAGEPTLFENISNIPMRRKDFSTFLVKKKLLSELRISR